MYKIKLVIALAIIVGASAIILALSLKNIFLTIAAGLVFVIGGTLLTTLISESTEKLLSLKNEAQSVFKTKPSTIKTDFQTFEKIAEYYRVGQIRLAESSALSIQDFKLRKGTLMVIDSFSFEQIEQFFLWSIAREKQEKNTNLQILQTMISLTPAIGMLGTLIGLVQLLFNLSSNGIEQAGISMGFAMITTFIGLFITNIILKPVALKMDKVYRKDIKSSIAKFELVKMLYQRQSTYKIKTLIKNETSFTSDTHLGQYLDNSMAYS